MLGVARPGARPTPKQLGIGIVVSAVTPQLQDEEQFSSPIFELGRPAKVLVKDSSLAVFTRYFAPQSTAFEGPRQPNIGPVYSSTVTPTSSLLMSSTVFTQAGCSS